MSAAGTSGKSTFSVNSSKLRAPAGVAWDGYKWVRWGDRWVPLTCVFIVKMGTDVPVCSKLVEAFASWNKSEKVIIALVEESDS